MDLVIKPIDVVPSDAKTQKTTMKFKAFSRS